MRLARWQIQKLWVLASALIFTCWLGGAVQAQQKGQLTYLPLTAKKGPTAAGDPARLVISLVNRERSAVGCRPLRMNVALNKAAQEHSEDMATHGFLSHEGSDGSEPGERMSRAGYKWSAAAENIAMGYASAEAVVDGWMNSSGHRANILDCRFQDTGVGHYYVETESRGRNYGHYWTMVFGTPR